MSTTTNRLARRARDIVEQDAREASGLLNDAFKSRAYLYPLKGIYYLLSHRDLQRPLLKKVTPAASTAATVTAAMFAVTYLPQVAVLTFVNGPLAVFSTIFLVLTESATITGLISRGFFMQETLVDVFDGTLLLQDQSKLVAKGRVVKSGSAADSISRLGRMVKKPFAKYTPSNVLRRFMYLPLNIIPIIGPIIYLFLNARRFGPTAHARYFQLKGMSKQQAEEWIDSRKAEYTGFGIPAMLLEMIPFVGIFFSFTNAVGAALWAADIEKSRPQPVPDSRPQSHLPPQETGTIPSDDPPPYEEL